MMPLPILTDLPPAPNPGDGEEQFDALAYPFTAALITMVPELRAYGVQLEALETAVAANAVAANLSDVDFSLIAGKLLGITAAGDAVRGLSIEETWTYLPSVVATTSGTNVPLLTGIPAGVSEIDLFMRGVGGLGDEQLLVRMGTATDGVVDDGYFSSSQAGSDTSVSGAFGSRGFSVSTFSDSREATGFVKLRKLPNFRWASEHTVCYNTGVSSGSGTVVLTEDADAVYISAGVFGNDPMEEGEVTVRYR